MTTTTPSAEAAPGAAGGCAVCGAAMEPDQEWCLECGVARTVVRRAPDWRLPALTAALVILAAVVGFALALAHLGDVAGPTTTRGFARSAAPARSAGSPQAAGTAAIASWPPGLSGWTVVLVSTPVKATAEAAARGFADAGLSVGVLDSSQHPLLRRRRWIVFSHRYALQTEAEAAAAHLVAAGHTNARAVEVAPPGGI